MNSSVRPRRLRSGLALFALGLTVFGCSLLNGPEDLLAPPADPGDGPGLACGEGTVEHDGACWPYDPTDETPPVTTATPPGGVVVAAPFYVLLETDEPATIYYTVDGSDPTTDSPSQVSPAEVFDIPDDGEVRHFAIDLAGNESEIQTESYPIDGDAPAPVTDLATSSTGDPANSVTVTWQPPGDSDFAGVLLVRSGGIPATFEPVAGAVFTAGDILGGGQDVAYVGDATEYVDDVPHGGSGYYTAWAYDAVYNYSVLESTTSDDLAVEQPQDGAIEIDTATETASISLQPRDFHLEIDSVSYDGEGEELSFTLRMKSLVGRYIHNPKLTVNSFSQGTIFNGTDGVLDGKPSMYFGANATSPGTVMEREILVRGVSGNPPVVTSTFELTQHPTIRVGGGYRNSEPIGFSDSSGSGFGTSTGCPAEHMPIPNGMNSQCHMGDGVLSADGRWFHVAFGSHPSVIKYDMENLTAVLSVELAPAGTAYGLTPSPDGAHLYVSLMQGRHRKTGTSDIQGFGFDGDMELVKLDAATLEEVGRVTLATAVTQGRVRDLSITTDGTRGAIALEYQSRVSLLDLENMSVVQHIATTNERPRIAALTPDGSQIFVFYSHTVDGEMFDTTSFAATPLPVQAGGSTVRLGGALFGADGRLYLARRPGDGSAGLIIFGATDPVNEQLALYTGNQMLGITFNADGSLLYAKTRGEQIAVLDVATDTPLLTRLAGSRVKGHHLTVTR